MSLATLAHGTLRQAPARQLRCFARALYLFKHTLYDWPWAPPDRLPIFFRFFIFLFALALMSVGSCPSPFEKTSPAVRHERPGRERRWVIQFQVNEMYPAAPRLPLLPVRLQSTRERICDRTCRDPDLPALPCPFESGHSRRRLSASCRLERLEFHRSLGPLPAAPAINSEKYRQRTPLLARAGHKGGSFTMAQLRKGDASFRTHAARR